MVHLAPRPGHCPVGPPVNGLSRLFRGECQHLFSNVSVFLSDYSLRRPVGRAAAALLPAGERLWQQGRLPRRQANQDGVGGDHRWRFCRRRNMHHRASEGSGSTARISRARWMCDYTPIAARFCWPRRASTKARRPPFEPKAAASRRCCRSPETSREPAEVRGSGQRARLTRHG